MFVYPNIILWIYSSQFQIQINLFDQVAQVKWPCNLKLHLLPMKYMCA